MKFLHLRLLKKNGMAFEFKNTILYIINVYSLVKIE